jgi:alkylation response protein AidB-like acyl-CoA dehydrogenase
MEFDLNKEQKMLQKSVRDFLSAKCTSENRRQWLSDPEGFSRKFYADMVELGWTGLPYTDAYGGMDGTFFELFLVVEEIGRWLVPGPFLTSAALSGMLIDLAGSREQKSEYLPAIIEGDRIFTVANLDEHGGRGETGAGVQAEAVRQGTHALTGTCLLVPFGHVADTILVWAELHDEDQPKPTVYLVDRTSAGITISSLDTFSPEKASAVRFEGAEVPEKNILGAAGRGLEYRERLLPKALVLKCAEMIGGLRQVLDMTVAYARERCQFGRPLGTLQIVQHYCADMAANLETARLLACQAASLIDQGVDCTKEAAMAQAWCSDVCRQSCLSAHQIFGAYGFTEECDLHLYTKHAKASELTFGHSWFHRSKVADTLGI